MKLSEAIRLGAMLRPQGFESFGLDLGNGQRVTCALGAAAEAIGSQSLTWQFYAVNNREVAEDLDAVFGEILNARHRRCPVKGCRTRRIPAGVIVHLNDGHRWTREQIAEWVETIENGNVNRSEGESRLEVPPVKGVEFRPDFARVQ